MADMLDELRRMKTFNDELARPNRLDVGDDSAPAQQEADSQPIIQEQPSQTSSQEAPKQSPIDDAEPLNAQASAVAQAEASQLQPPTQEFGVLGNIGAGLGLLGALTGIPEAQQLGSGLLGILDRQQQNDKANFARDQEKIHRQSFAKASQGLFGFDNDRLKIMQELPPELQAKLNISGQQIQKQKVKDERTKLIEGHLKTLGAGLLGNDKIKFDVALAAGDHNTAMAIQRDAKKVILTSLPDIERQLFQNKLNPYKKEDVRKAVELSLLKSGKKYNEKDIDQKVESYISVNDPNSNSPGFIAGFTDELAKEAVKKVGTIWNAAKGAIVHVFPNFANNPTNGGPIEIGNNPKELIDAANKGYVVKE